MRQQIVQIDNMTKDDLKKLLEDALKPQPSPTIKKILNSTVDRAYIKRNLNLSHRQVLKYEREGVLLPIKNNNSISGSAYYRIADVVRLMELTKI